MNIFMEQVKNATTFSWKNISKYIQYKRKLKKFIKNIDEGTPSFGVLWYFSEFIQYAEIIYSFDNNKNGQLYSSSIYNPGQTGFKISTNDLNIVVKLYSSEQKVGIDIQNKNSGKISSNYTFINQKWEKEPDEYDLLLIDRIIEIINKHMIGLTLWCIDKKLTESQHIPKLV